MAAVVPHGGLTPFITPNPIAAGLPTSGDPMLVDVSTSITSMGYARQQMLAGKQLPGAWLIDAEGNPTADPGVLFNEPKGALLPLGGLDAGHKGFALALLIEAMTAGLAGHGRADPPCGLGRLGFCAGHRSRGVQRAWRHLRGSSISWPARRASGATALAANRCGCPASVDLQRYRDGACARGRAVSDDPAGARALGAKSLSASRAPAPDFVSGRSRTRVVQPKDGSPLQRSP